MSIDGVGRRAGGTSASDQSEPIEILFGKDKELSFESMSKLVAIEGCDFKSNPAG